MREKRFNTYHGQMHGLDGMESLRERILNPRYAGEHPEWRQPWKAEKASDEQANRYPVTMCRIRRTLKNESISHHLPLFRK